MGTWGTAILSNDTSADVKGEYIDLLGEGTSGPDATDRLIERYLGRGRTAAGGRDRGAARAQRREHASRRPGQRDAVGAEAGRPRDRGRARATRSAPETKRVMHSWVVGAWSELDGRLDERYGLR